jgi:lipoprotein NlpI
MITLANSWNKNYLSIVNRLEQLQKFYQDEPNDPFNLYALALEISKSQHEQGYQVFKQLMTGFPDYIPAYYQAALLSMNLSRTEETKSILQYGMSWAKSKNDMKAFNELQQLWNELEGEI